MSKQIDLGEATAYAIAKKHGYVGTEAQFAEEMTGAAQSAREAAQDASDAEAYAKGTRDGVDVGSSDSAYHNNAKYWAQQAPNITSLAPAYSASATYAVGDLVTYNNKLYTCVSAITTAEAWTAAHWSETSTGTELTNLKGDLKAEIENLDVITPDFKSTILALFNAITFEETNGPTLIANFTRALNGQPLDPLDEIAYGNLTFRDLFVDGNLITIGDFENVTIPSEEIVYPNGDRYSNAFGNPQISSDESFSGEHSLKAFGTTSNQILYRVKGTRKQARLLWGLTIDVKRYVQGHCGAQLNIQSFDKTEHGTITYNGVSITTGDLVNDDITDGFVTLCRVVDINYQYDSDVYYDMYIGTYVSANADDYIDNVVLCYVPDEMTDEEGLNVYTRYLNIVKK